MTDHDFVLAVERMAEGIAKDLTSYQGIDGAIMAKQMITVLFLLIGALRSDPASIGVLMASQDAKNGNTENMEKLLEAWNKKHDRTTI